MGLCQSFSSGFRREEAAMVTTLLPNIRDMSDAAIESPADHAEGQSLDDIFRNLRATLPHKEDSFEVRRCWRLGLSWAMRSAV